MSPGCDESVNSIADAYSSSSVRWQAGPGRIYDRLAEELVGTVDLEPASTWLDLGAGTGAASRAASARGADVVAVDVAFGMVRTPNAGWRSAVAADALALPFCDRSFDVVVAAFSLNHVSDPESALREVRRVLRRGGRLAASVYSSDDSHPVKAAVNTAALESGWVEPPWYRDLAASAMPLLATPERGYAALRAAGLRGAARIVRVAFPQLEPDDLIDWRLGLAQYASIHESMPQSALAVVQARARELLGAAPPPLVRAMVVLTAVS